MPTIQLRDLCAVRAGDKGDTSNVALFAYDEPAYRAIHAAVTADKVKAHYGSLVLGEVTRHEAPNVWALNFVMRGALGGGGSRSLRSDSLGKTLGGVLLRMEIEVSDEVLGAAPFWSRRPKTPDHHADATRLE
jgi:hypothetical protein